MTNQDYMRRAIELAKKGIGFVNPNPLVGAVIVKDGRIIAEGYHAVYGGLHAERSAIAALQESAEGAAIYVTLEPCCHYGKQPPCTEAIIEQGIKRVVVGSRDPNPAVAGKGVKMLRDAGIIVEEDVLREECDALNPIFFHYITTKTPYVVMKYAMTADGKIATRTGASKWITGKAAREHVQYMRSVYMGIMVGIGTVLLDDPMLNVRVEGKRSPVRIICDSKLRIPPDCKLCKTAEKYRTIVAYAKENPEKLEELHALGVETVCAADEKGTIDLKKLMGIVGAMGIDSILIEGGGTLNDSAMRCGIVQKLFAFVAPKIFGGESAKAPVAGEGVSKVEDAVLMELLDVTKIGEDLLLEYNVKG